MFAAFLSGTGAHDPAKALDALPPCRRARGDDAELGFHFAAGELASLVCDETFFSKEKAVPGLVHGV